MIIAELLWYMDHGSPVDGFFKYLSTNELGRVTCPATGDGGPPGAQTGAATGRCGDSEYRAGQFVVDHAGRHQSKSAADTNAIQEHGVELQPLGAPQQFQPTAPRFEARITTA